MGHAVLHEPRVVVTSSIADDPEEERRRLEAAIDELKAAIDEMLEQGELSSPANTATCSKPIACSPTTAAGCRREGGDHAA